MINVRKAQTENALECAVIIDSWISKTKEMPRLYSKIELEQMIKEAIPLREAWLVCSPAKGYISLNQKTLQKHSQTKSTKGPGRLRAIVEMQE